MCLKVPQLSIFCISWDNLIGLGSKRKILIGEKQQQQYNIRMSSKYTALSLEEEQLMKSRMSSSQRIGSFSGRKANDIWARVDAREVLNTQTKGREA